MMENFRTNILEGGVRPEDDREKLVSHLDEILEPREGNDALYQIVKKEFFKGDGLVNFDYADKSVLGANGYDPEALKDIGEKNRQRWTEILMEADKNKGEIPEEKQAEFERLNGLMKNEDSDIMIGLKAEISRQLRKFTQASFEILPERQKKVINTRDIKVNRDVLGDVVKFSHFNFKAFSERQERILSTIRDDKNSQYKFIQHILNQELGL